MSTLISVLIIIVSILLVLIVLVQNSKGGGLASGFSASSQVMGVRKTTDFLEKATWTLAIALVVLCLASNMVGGPSTEQLKDTELREKINEAPEAKPLNMPNNVTPGGNPAQPAQPPAQK